MPYIVMAVDECGQECRPSSKEHATFDLAFEEKHDLQERYCEYRSFWVEELRDKQWYIENRLAQEEW